MIFNKSVIIKIISTWPESNNQNYYTFVNEAPNNYDYYPQLDAYNQNYILLFFTYKTDKIRYNPRDSDGL